MRPPAPLESFAADAQHRSVMDPEEAGWLARARAGEERAQVWLFDRYRHRVVRLAAHVLRGRPDDPEDAAQETMIRALQGLHTYRGDAPFANWLYRITVRTCLEMTRRAPRRREIPLETTEWSASLAAAVAGGAGGEAGASDARLLVASLLDELSPPIRAALILRELEGLSYEEVAAVLNVPVGTVRSRLSAARLRFRELYAAVQKETDDV